MGMGLPLLITPPQPTNSSTYDHTILRARLPVRSALFKQDTGGLVVRWVTTSESPLLYVFGSRGLLFATDLNIAQGV
jgi:hypothetical protein